MPGPTAPPSPMAIFNEALDLGSPSERCAYLDRACSGDAALRARVEALLAVHDRAGDFLESPASWPTIDAIPTEAVEKAGTIIGPYTLREQIGEGGMGVVYVAEQSQPVRRKVALKIVKPGMDTRQVVARFEAERQALAMMDHPNIAKVHDGGTTDSGRPFFVMELVRGLPITDYCDAERLPIRERLELFVLVCRAVQHAHQKGIIHRDLKPSNVLVTRHDGVPVPKVIDFGVAKAIGGGLTEKTVYTAFAQLVGTPLYMSPEQVELSGLDVDTRSDIYALGVLLYELLTGTTPFDSETLKQAAFDELRRILREEEPPRPSTRLSSLGATLTTTSAKRSADPRQLNRSVRGELDWIVMKALEKDRRRRYETAGNFAADVMRYLTDEPVEACPPSASYRLAKFARRNRFALAAATAAVLAVLLAIAGLTASTLLITRQRNEAAEAYRQALALYERHPEAGPAGPKGIHYNLGNPSTCYDELGELLWQLGEHEEGRQVYRKLFAHWERTGTHLGQQWVLATCPYPELRDPARSLKLAEAEFQTRERDGGDWTCQGAAYYYAGDGKAAVEALEKAAALGERGINDFLLAIVQGKLGNQDQAHRCYRRGVEETKIFQYLDPSVRRFRAEAEELLGIKGNQESRDILGSRLAPDL